MAGIGQKKNNKENKHKHIIAASLPTRYQNVQNEIVEWGAKTLHSREP